MEGSIILQKGSIRYLFIVAYKTKVMVYTIDRSIRYLFIVAYKTLVVSRDLKLIKDSHPKYVISMDRLYLTELLSLQGVWDKTWET